MSYLLSLLLIFSYTISYAAPAESDERKSHLEDIFIWKMSDELKLTTKEEKKFTEIHKALNKKKADLNREIQDSIQRLNDNSTEAELKKYRRLIQDYNQISLAEFDSIKTLLGDKKFVSYLKIKNELTSKVKSILIGDRTAEKKETKKLPAPKVIIEGQD